MSVAAQRLVIVADDLTGAADSAGRACSAGLPAEVRLPGAEAPALPAGVVALTSDTRHLAPEPAGERVRRLVAPLAAAPGTAWYKKVDSALRGNIAAELAAMLAALGRRHAVVAPAFPAQGRGLRHGALVGGGLPGTLHLPSLLRAGGQAVAAIPLHLVRAGAATLADRLATVAAEARIIVADALADDDLRTIALAAERALPAALLCGSAGLAGVAAARALAAPIESPSLARAPVGEPALIVVGSGCRRAHAQIAHARAAGIYALVPGERPPDPGADLLLHLPPPPAGLPLDGPASRAAAEALAEAAEALAERQGPGLLVLVGGDTALCLLRRLGVGALVVERELLPGVPLAYGVDGHGRERAVVLKAGSFGDDRVLAEILRLARGGEQ